jgi:hypothetical protein
MSPAHVAAAQRFVLDGVLRLRSGERFITGFQAAELLPAAPREPPSGTISLAALGYAAALGLDDPGTLAGRLYHFGRTPLTSSFLRELANSGGVPSYCGLIGRAPAARAIKRMWSVMADDAHSRAWIQYRRTEWIDRQPAQFKVYVNVPAHELRDRLPRIIDRLSETSCSYFKLGADADNLLRPDNFVAYFATWAHAVDGARRLQRECRDMRGAGVPFTGATRSPLVSWGIDPPESFCQMRGMSWRSWICGRLASHLITAARTGASTPTDRVSFALRRLALDGIDPHAWRPRVIGAGAHLP